jgi:Fe-S-cluster containining protein
MPESAVLISKCRRCGTCCKKGGPSLHMEDLHLVTKGAIHTRYLYTLRKGELAFDNVRGKLAPVAGELIKIKGRATGWTCIFYDEIKNACTIYTDRPIECRVLKCWDTRAIEQMYTENRLTRRHLLSGVKGLWGLVEDHGVRCDYALVNELVQALSPSCNNAAAKNLIEMIGYDTQIRRLVVEKSGVDEDMTDFLFGRPLLKTITTLGLNVKRSGRMVQLVPAPR